MTAAPHPMPGLWLTEVRNAAVSYVRHGWPVRLSVPTSSRAERTQAIDEDEITDPDVALRKWTQAPYPILLSCGRIVTAIEVSSLVSRNALGALRAAGVLGPIIAAPFSTDYLLVAPGRQGHGLGDDDTAGRYLARGSQVILPPTAVDEPLYRWRISPTAVSWKLPNLPSLQRELHKFLTSDGTTPGRLVRSGQI
jgi:hypothetical protein